MKRKVRVLMLLCMLVLSLGGMAVAGRAAEEDITAMTAQVKKTGWVKNGKWYSYYTKTGKAVTGWQKIDGKLYYFRKQAEGNAPAGSRATGLYTIGDKTFYFSAKGVLQTGWKKISGKNYYFEPSGKTGTIGQMYTGFHKIKSDGRSIRGRPIFSVILQSWVSVDGRSPAGRRSARTGISSARMVSCRKIAGSVKNITLAATEKC